MATNEMETSSEGKNIVRTRVMRGDLIKERMEGEGVDGDRRWARGWRVGGGFVCNWLRVHDC